MVRRRGRTTAGACCAVGSGPAALARRIAPPHRAALRASSWAATRVAAGAGPASAARSSSPCVAHQCCSLRTAAPVARPELQVRAEESRPASGRMVRAGPAPPAGRARPSAAAAPAPRSRRRARFAGLGGHPRGTGAAHDRAARPCARDLPRPARPYARCSVSKTSVSDSIAISRLRASSGAPRHTCRPRVGEIPAHDLRRARRCRASGRRRCGAARCPARHWSAIARARSTTSARSESVTSP